MCGSVGDRRGEGMSVLPPRGPVSDQFEPEGATKTDELTVLK